MSHKSDQLKAVDAGIGRQVAQLHANLLVEAIRLNGQKIHFTAQTNPDISIVIVSYNAANLLCMTLANLASHQAGEKSKFEVIIIDNASDSETRDILNRVENARIVYNEKNEGFGPACNRGAHLGSGRHILFLNPDIDLMPGALDAMVKGFELYDDVGIVGARLVFPGGTLQEAGAFFLDDAQLTHPYLRGLSDPSAPEALFAREVGYVSGAALMIERDLFERLAGFDDAFAPAYYEDTDLCLRCAQLGRRIIYQPRAIAFHYENATSPSRENVETLLSKHRDVLLKRHRNWLFESGASPAGFMTREPDRNRFRVLYIDDRVPHVDSGAGLPRANSIINLMTKMGYLVTMLPVYDIDSEPSARYRDVDPRIEILEPGALGELKRIIDQRPGYYDLLWVSRPHNVDFVVKTFLECGVQLRNWVKSRIVFDTEALFSARQAIMELNHDKHIDSSLLRHAIRLETSFSNLADVVVCVSNGESQLLKKIGGVTHVKILGHLMTNEPGPSAFEDRNGVLFVGPLVEDGTPNVDSIDWFLTHAWPIVSARLGTRARLVLVGNITREIRTKFERHDVVALGRVDDLQDVFNSVRLSIAPTRFAAGIPQKVHNCVGHGVPMVITPLLMAQLSWNDSVGCLSAPWQDARAFAEAVLTLHEDQAVWRAVRERGLKQVYDECNQERFRHDLRDICEGQMFL